MIKKKIIVGVVIAREGSSRLPGKALVNVEGKPMIGHIVDRLKSSKYIDQVIIATTTNKLDDGIYKFGVSTNTKVFRGHPEDVLGRLYSSVENINADAIIEVGGDCPFISTKLLNKGIQIYLDNPGVDMVSNCMFEPFTFPDGYDFILLTKQTLTKVHNKAKLESERFQPFQYIFKNKHLFKIKSFENDKNFSKWRWTLDYEEDLTLVKKVYKELYKKDPFFGFKEISELIKNDNSLLEINKVHVSDLKCGNQAWYTGSYVDECHNDIKRLLKIASRNEKTKNFIENEGLYNQINKITTDLIERSKTRKING